MKASDNQRKLRGTRAWRFSQASKVRGLEVDMKRDTANSTKPSPVVSIQTTAGSSECPGESKTERLCHNCPADHSAEHKEKPIGRLCNTPCDNCDSLS